MHARKKRAYFDILVVARHRSFERKHDSDRAGRQNDEQDEYHDEHELFYIRDALLRVPRRVGVCGVCGGGVVVQREVARDDRKKPARRAKAANEKRNRSSVSRTRQSTGALSH